MKDDIRWVVFHHENNFEVLTANARMARGRFLVHIPHGAEGSVFQAAARPWHESKLLSQ